MTQILKTLVLVILSILASMFTARSQDIYDAIEQDDAESVKLIIAEHAELLNQRNEVFKTPLNFAAELGKAGMARILLDLGADPYIGDRENSMPIHMAAISGNVETVDLFLDNGMDVDTRDLNEMTPLHFALAYNQSAMARHLIERGADVNAQNINSFSPLHYAAIRGDMESARLLLKKKANINDIIVRGGSPLFSAVSFGHTDLVRFLVENGANINQEAEDGSQALSAALNPNTYDAAAYLIEKGADVMHRNNSRLTALHFVAGRGTGENIAELLLDHGADIDAVSLDGRTPLTFAAYSRNPEGMTRFLILNGADVNPDPCSLDKACTCGPVHTTPLHAAVSRNQLGMAEILVSNGAKVNVYDAGGQTPLHLAIQAGSVDLVKYLVDHGAFINTGEKNTGSTALHLAVAMGYGDIVDQLLVEDADIRALDKEGRTSLDYAWYYNHKDIAYTLLASGADDNTLKDHLNAPCLLDKALGEGQAMVWFLGHSGWAVKTQNHFLVFDYFTNQWNQAPDDSCLASGFICPEEIKGQNVTVFSTHEHGDHFDPRIFEWQTVIPDAGYVLCWEPSGIQNSYTLIPVHEQAEVNGMDVYVNYSTDLGGGYFVEVDGLNIWHMGDLANGEDGLMKAFTDEVDRIAGTDKRVDIVFGGIRGCSLGQPEQVRQGLYYVLEKLDPSLFIPMHSGGHSFENLRFAEEAKEDGMETPMRYVIHRGDRFIYDRNKTEELVTEL